MCVVENVEWRTNGVLMLCLDLANAAKALALATESYLTYLLGFGLIRPNGQTS